MKAYKTSLLLALAAAAFGPLQGLVAAPSTQEQTYTVVATPTDWSKTPSFAKFDTTLGTLISVDFSLSSSVSTTLTVTNNSASASTGSVRTSVSLAVNDPSDFLGYYLPTPPGDPVGNTTLDVITATQGYSLGAGATSTLLTKTKTGSTTFNFVDGATLAEFSGPGAIDLSFGTFTTTLLSNTGGNTFASQVTTVSSVLTLTYSYTPIEVSAVPEPATYAALSGGAVLMGVLFLRRRKNGVTLPPAV